jgi:hypothetical protein
VPAIADAAARVIRARNSDTVAASDQGIGCGCLSGRHLRCRGAVTVVVGEEIVRITLAVLAVAYAPVDGSAGRLLMGARLSRTARVDTVLGGPCREIGPLGAP